MSRRHSKENPPAPGPRREAPAPRAAPRPQAAARGVRLPAPVASDPRADWLALALLIFGLIVWHSSLAGAFLLDDHGRIVGNAALERLRPITTHLSKPRPLVTLSLAINHSVGGTNTWGYHVVNVGVHLLAGLLLFGIVRRTLDHCASDRPASGGSAADGDDSRRKAKAPAATREHAPLRRAAPWLAFAAAALWMAHPLQTQSVTYVIQRAEAMMGMFYLLTLYCLIRGAGRVDDPTYGVRLRCWFIAAALACLAGMGCKEVMITAPFMVLLYDRIFLSGSFAATLRRRWPLYLALFATTILVFTHGVGAGLLAEVTGQETGATVQRDTVGFGVPGVSWWHYLLTQTGVIARYLQLSVWPAGLVLDYYWPMATGPAEVLAPGLAVLGLLGFSAVLLWKRPRLGYLAAWFFVVLAPTSSFVPVKDPIFEHRMYLPLAAVVVAAVLLGYRLLGAIRDRLGPAPAVRLAAGAVLLVAPLSALGIATIRRNRVYHSPLAMWQDVAAKQPNSARAHNNLGIALFEQDRLDEAIAEYRRAFELDPTLRGPGQNLVDLRERFRQAGIDYMEEGDKERALEWFRRADAAAPGDIRVTINLANVLSELNRRDEAIETLRRGLSAAGPAAPGNLRAMAHYNLGNGLLGAERRQEAIAEYRRAIEADPTYANAYYGLGWVMQLEQRYDEAVEPYGKALELDPEHKQAREELDKLMAHQSREAEKRKQKGEKRENDEGSDDQKMTNDEVPNDEGMTKPE